MNSYTSELQKRIFTSLVLLPSILLLIRAPHTIFGTVIRILVTLIAVTEWPRFFRPESTAFWILLVLYIMFPFWCITQLHAFSPLLTFVLVGTVSAHDIGSYIAGKRWGRYLLWPAVSPKKTWEGFFGGCCATLLTTLVFFYSITTTQISIPNAFSVLIILSLSISVTALAGDLLESYFKRRAGIKDSGSLLPGHGGLLDRFDALMLTGILFYVLRVPLSMLFR
jgi:phosphatidate cytidylyltransferase